MNIIKCNIYNFIDRNENKFSIKQNFGQPGIIINFVIEKFDGEIDFPAYLNLSIDISSNVKLCIAGDCITKTILNESNIIELTTNKKNNYVKIYPRNFTINDYFIIESFDIKPKATNKDIQITYNSNKNIIDNATFYDNLKISMNKKAIKENKNNKIKKKPEIKVIQKDEIKPIEIKKNDNEMKFMIKNYYENEIVNYNYFNDNNINQVCISKSLKSFDRIKELYKLRDYDNKKEPCLFFGCYNLEDLGSILKHEGDKYVMFGGTDADINNPIRYKYIESLKKYKIKYISISKCIQDRLEKIDVSSELINFNLTDENKFKQLVKYGNSIYVYNGRNPDNFIVYNNDLCMEVVKKFPEFNFIESVKINKSHDEMNDIYKECFLGLRLTKYDGNANTVQEMGTMGIPVIHNSKLPNALNWNTIEDIELHIRYSWIEKFMKEISSYKRIVFIATDYPNYGGVATNTYKLIKFFEKAGHKVCGLFIHDEIMDKHEYGDNIFINSNIKKGIHKINNYYKNEKPDLIIIRNHCDINIIRTRYDCPIYFFVPGLFLPTLNKKVKDIISKKEFDTYIHPKIIYTIKFCHKIFTSNYDTQQILKKYANIDSEIMYYNYIPFYPRLIDKEIENTEREYYLGVIMSDFTRGVKNINEIRNILLKNSNKMKIAIGKNSNIFEGIPNIECYDLLDNKKVMEYMKKIKYLVNESFFESTSNVILEGQFSGCKIYNNSIEKNNILIVSTQYPNYGGAATLAYKLHEYLLSNNINSFCLFLDKNFTKQNPNNLKNVHMIDYTTKYDVNRLKEYINKNLGYEHPNLIIGFNYLAPLEIRKTYPTTKLVYYITGSKYISDKNVTSYEFLNRETKNLDEQISNEILSIEKSDYVLPNSFLSQNVFYETYYHYVNKLLEPLTLEYLFYDDNIPIKDTNRPYDILFVASRYDRDVKNIKLLKDIYEDIRIKNLKKVCIGKFSEKYIRNSNDILHIGFIDDNEIDKYMQKTKILIITSKFESMSITLIKALQNNCMVLCSNNVGAGYLLDPFYIVELNKDAYIEKIKLLLSNYNYYHSIIKNNTYMINKNKIIEDINKICNLENNNKYNVLICSIDTPHIGGAATNAYNLMREMKEYYNITGLFISSKYNTIDPENLGNINFLEMNQNIEDTANELINRIINERKIDCIFVKNYKCYCIIYRTLLKLGYDIPIIFSPSGSRFMNLEKNNNMNNMEDIYDEESLLDSNIYNIELIRTMDTKNLYELITEYDNQLEYYVINKAKYILPNSNITFNLLNQVYNNLNTIHFPINITYIDYEKIVINKNKREYDYGFVCYSWKRKIKGLDITKKIIERLTKLNKKILIVGYNSGYKNGNNITSINNLQHDELIKYLQNTKTVIFTSYYDSSPNVLKEALSCDCNVVLSTNIGNYDLINSKYVVTDIQNIDEWIEKINLSEKVSQENKISIDKKDIQLKLSNYILTSIKTNNYKEKKSVGIYKLPATWEIEYKNDIMSWKETKYNIETYDISKYKYIMNEIYMNADNDIYYRMYKTESNKRNIYNQNYIIINPTIFNNLELEVSKIVPFESRFSKIYVIKTCKDLFSFKNHTFYFVRGNYYNLYSNLVSLNETILYPATSLIYNNKFELEIQKQINHKFSYLLYDEPNNKELWQKMFPNSEMMHFKKKANYYFKYKQLTRIYDIIFVASENQSTKNHNLFMDFIGYMEMNNIKITVVFVGKNEDLMSLILNNVKLINYPHVNHKDLVDLYNQSKINLILSGRDALPRVICESLSCGCYNIVLDTLSDGKYIFENKKLGEILSYPYLPKIYDKSKKSISYQSHETIFQDIVKRVDKNYNHEAISSEFINS